MPALWQEFGSLLQLCPDQKVEVRKPQQVQQVYRWVNDLDYQDSDGRISDTLRPRFESSSDAGAPPARP